VAEALSRPKK